VIEKLLAALVLIVCLVLLGRMMLPERQQQRFDALLRDWRDRLSALRHRRPWQRARWRVGRQRLPAQVVQAAAEAALSLRTASVR
jgi:hypothetical protein